jgi:hypothetical protein
MIFCHLLTYGPLRHFWRRTGMLGVGLAWLLGLSPALGQADISARFARYAQRAPTEKLFLHLDRPGYVSGETMWFKVYAVEGDTHHPLAASKVAYVEVLNQERKPVLQGKIALQHATGQGSLVLPATLASGRYTVRAYTSWMRNFSPELYFQSPVTITNTRTPLGLPAVARAVTYDAQFFPEGGYLVQGLNSKVGFKIMNSAGQSVEAEGTVLDQTGTAVAQFKTLRFGLGSFSFTPTKAGASYTAIIRLPNKQTVTSKLPLVREQGYVLRLEDAGPTQLRLVVQSSAGLPAESLYLLGHAGAQVAAATAAPLYNGQAVFLVEKQKLRDGISHFTLFNSRREPLCERLYFRPPAAKLALTAQTDKAQYGPREKVSLQLTATGAAGKPQPASLSVAVYQLDSLSAAAGADVAGYLWLTSDLRGSVENPDYYLSAAGPEVAAAADNLMLTQGWSRFKWNDVLADQPESLAYLPELNGHLVRGRVVSTATGAPAAGITAYLSSPSRHIELFNSVSKADGSVQFEVPGLYGAKQLIAQTDTQRDSLYRVEILSPFSLQYATTLPVPMALTPGTATSLQRRHVQTEVQQRYFGRQSVVYKAPRIDSTAFYGKPNEHYRLDDYTRFKVMEEVMREYVPGVLVRIRKDGFHFIVPDNNAKSLTENPLVLLDGMPVFNTNRIMAFDPLKVQTLDVVTTRYFLGPLIYNGIVSYTTYKGDLAGFPLDAHALLQDYEGLQAQRDFYAPRYDTPQAKQSRLPDFRNLLYWNPEAAPAGTGIQPSFFTSDQAGRYRVVVQGLGPDGTAGSTSFTFEVKSAL